MSKIRHDTVAPTTTALHAAGEMIDRHSHEEHQFACVTSGVLAVRTPEGLWVAPPGRGVWLPAGTWHEHRFYGDSSFHTIGFPTADPAHGIPAAMPLDRPVIVDVNSLAREVIIACTAPGVADDEYSRLAAVLGDQLARLPHRPTSLPTPADPRLARACELVTTDLSQPLSLPDLAGAVHVSDRTLARLFRAELAMTYPQWRTAVRIYQALIDLAEGRSITETGHRCGWATTSAFIDSFRRATGQTPGAYVRHRGNNVPLPVNDL